MCLSFDTSPFYIYKEDKLYLSRTFSCKHESSAFDLHYLCNVY